jgi:hypothetical protein
MVAAAVVVVATAVVEAEAEDMALSLVKHSRWPAEAPTVEDRTVVVEVVVEGWVCSSAKPSRWRVGAMVVGLMAEDRMAVEEEEVPQRWWEVCSAKLRVEGATAEVRMVEVEVVLVDSRSMASNSTDMDSRSMDMADMEGMVGTTAVDIRRRREAWAWEGRWPLVVVPFWVVR